MEYILDDVSRKLKDKDYKLTPQRKFVLEIFAKNRESHLSAEDVYGIIRQTHPEIGLATIYRTLDLFAALDILQKMDFGDGRARYEFFQSNVHHHHHLICLKCGNVEGFEDDLLETLECAIEKTSGFQIVDHQLKFFGYCNKCK